MNKSLQIQYKAETGRSGLDVQIQTCPYCRKVNTTTGNVAEAYIEWLENKVIELQKKDNG
jgi:hypothetical protein